MNIENGEFSLNSLLVILKVHYLKNEMVKDSTYSISISIYSYPQVYTQDLSVGFKT